MTITDKVRNWIKKKWDDFDETPEWLIKREGWGAKPPKPEEDIGFKVKTLPEYLPWPLSYVVIHSALPCLDPGTNREEIIKTIQEIQNEHMEDDEYDDIGYNFVIGGDGYVYEGTGWQIPGAHCFTLNEESIGVAFLGDFSENAPNKDMISAARQLIEEGMKKGYLDQEVKIVTHAQVAEEAKCPDEILRKEIEENKVLEPDINWSEYGWVYACKRWLEAAPEGFRENMKERLKLMKTMWKNSMIYTCLMYIWHN